MQRPNGIVRRDETILRLGVWGCGFPMTWSADDRQFLVIVDGWGSATPATKAYHSRMYTVCGEPPNLVFEDVAGYPDMLIRVKGESEFSSFWGGSSLVLDGCLYQYLTTSNVPWFKPDGGFSPDFHWIGSKLIYSPDNGRTWHNQDGTSPVIEEEWQARSRDNMAFFNEDPAGAFAWLSFLQMGRGYELNKDGYVYVYSPNGYLDGTINELVMFRVPKSRIRDRTSYEFFSGLRSIGTATWTKDIAARAVVHKFPRGWVNGSIPGQTPWAWIPSVAYIGPLGGYLMTSWGMGCTSEGVWFGKPSYLGFWFAPTPWGPFEQIHEELAWAPANDQAARAFMPQIAPKWLSADGKSLWLVWSDYQYKGASGDVENPDRAFVEKHRITDDAEYSRVGIEWAVKHMRHYHYNLQRIDLIVK